MAIKIYPKGYNFYKYIGLVSFNVPGTHAILAL